LIAVSDFERASEVLSELVARRQLQRFAVAHHRLAGDRGRGAGEPLGGRLDAAEDGHRQGVAQESPIDVLVDEARIPAASSRDACAVCPSCHRNSLVRRKTRGRSSHRTTFAHWLSRSGRSR
jgi:hypothetical protein